MQGQDDVPLFAIPQQAAQQQHQTTGQYAHAPPQQAAPQPYHSYTSQQGQQHAAQQQQRNIGAYAHIPSQQSAQQTHSPYQQQHHPQQISQKNQQQQQHPRAPSQQQQQQEQQLHQLQQSRPPQQVRQVTPPSSGNVPQVKRAGDSRRKSLEQKMLVTKTPDEEFEDGRSRNPEAALKIKDAWIYQQIRARQAEFTGYRQALCFVGTWNVNAKGKEESLDDWICADWGPNGEYPPDIVVVGFQEIVDLNAVNVAVDKKTQERSQFWVERIRQTLNSPKNTRNDPRRGYYLLQQRSLVGLLICVYVRQPHQERIKWVHSSSVGVGVMGMMGNKGGVSIRLQFYDSTICFVCSHLAAHRENVEGRNADYANVFNKTNFEIGEDPIKESIRSGSLSHWAIGTSSMGIIDHDLVVWLGDLNYRVDEIMPTEKVLSLSEKGQIEKLRTLDQLNIERGKGNAFGLFEEGPLNFPPTYKYQPGTEMYEQRPDKKLRAPAWCDRILWMAQEPQHVQQLTYNRSVKPNISDHKAVYSTMRFTIKDVVLAKREKIYAELMKLLDRFENQTLPMVGLDRVNLDFGEVRYDQSLTLPIQITNTGNVVAQFRLVPKLDEKTLCKPWLRISPTYGMLIPGENPATMNVTVTIDRSTAQLLNSGREVLEDILILRLENGRDYYITVKATFARSCFGMSVDELVLYSDPIRTIPLDPIKLAERLDPNPASALCVPKELWRVIDAICEKGLQEQDLFVQPGYASEAEQIRECLDTGAPFGQFSIHSYAEVMLSFFSSLHTPIISPRLFPTIEIDAQNIQSSARRFLEELQPVHYNVFVYVISFFREALLYRDRNKLTAAKLARVCCKHMARSVSGGPDTGMQLIIMHLLETNSI